jgi:diaminohydroxyphosphoribosylaminopyrimidine deaminase/5-amino-6-(5-phosphoribosylamino)uracil reductase
MPAMSSPTPFSADDHRHMARALQLAAHGLYSTEPNPRVGCVIVRDGAVVGEGFHLRAGEPHAEVHALREAGDLARGATVYVTLEPCSHHGRTGPCAEALVAAGPARVVVAMQDPNPRVCGNGIARLRTAGITVDAGLLAAEAAALNPGFIARMSGGRPWVRLKLAMSLDGRTAMASGESQWITGPEAREDVQRLRARSGAVVTGIGTLLADDPALTVRADDWRHGSYGSARVRQPLRVLLDRHLRAPAQARLFDGAGPVLVTCAGELLASGAGQALADPLRARGAEVTGLPAASAVSASAGGLDLHALLAELARREVNEVLVEAGARLAGAFVQAGLVDELVIYSAPVLMGSQARPLIELPIAQMAGRLPLVVTDVRQVGADIRMSARFQPAL